jgi:hypothetical protein
MRPSGTSKAKDMEARIRDLLSRGYSSRSGVTLADCDVLKAIAVRMGIRASLLRTVSKKEDEANERD